MPMKFARWIAIYLFCAVSLSPAGQEAVVACPLRNVEVGDEFPSFTLSDLEGKAIDRDRLLGRPSIVLFVRPGQKPSLQALDDLQELLENHPDDPLNALAVSSDPDTLSFFEKIRAERNCSFMTALDTDRTLYGALGLIVSPTTLVVDRGGVLRFIIPHMPPGYKHDLELHVDLLLGRIGKEEHDRRLDEPSDTLSEKEKSFNRRMALARRLIEKQQYKPALDLLNAMRSENDEDPSAAAFTAKALLALGRIEEAEACVSPFRNMTAPPRILRVVTARLDIGHGRTEGALQLAERSELPSDDRCDLFYELGRYYEARQSTKEAMTCYRKALELVRKNNEETGLHHGLRVNGMGSEANR